VGGCERASPFKKEDHLRSLNLRSNRLTGTLPSALGSFSQLIYLRIENNRIHGTIPPEIGELEALEHIHIGGNDLSGTIPFSFYNLRNLKFVWIHDTQIGGTIADGIQNLRNLQSLYLHKNDLEGTLPEELAYLPQLERLKIYGNRLRDESKWKSIFGRGEEDFDVDDPQQWANDHAALREFKRRKYGSRLTSRESLEDNDRSLRHPWNLQQIEKQIERERHRGL